MSRRHVGAIGGAIVSVLLAGLLAATINLGILRAAGPLRGPGRLGPVDVSSVVSATSPSDPGGEGQGPPAPNVRAAATPKGPDGEQESNADD